GEAAADPDGVAVSGLERALQIRANVSRTGGRVGAHHAGGHLDLAGPAAGEEDTAAGQRLVEVEGDRVQGDDAVPGSRQSAAVAGAGLVVVDVGMADAQRHGAAQQDAAAALGAGGAVVAHETVVLDGNRGATEVAGHVQAAAAALIAGRPPDGVADDPAVVEGHVDVRESDAAALAGAHGSASPPGPGGVADAGAAAGAGLASGQNV